MGIQKLTLRSLWLSLVIVSLLCVLNIFHVRNFLEQSETTSAAVLSVSDGLFVNKTTFRFTSKLLTVVDAENETIQSFTKGDSVDVVYNRLIPAQIYVDTFLDLWLSPLFYAALIVLIAGVILVFNYVTNRRANRKKDILRHGTHIYTEFKAVEAVIKVKKEGKHPYQIISSWHDKTSNKTYLFKSEYLWENPSDYIMDESITVKIDSKNKKKYIMDLSFLPDSFH